MIAEELVEALGTKLTLQEAVNCLRKRNIVECSKRGVINEKTLLQMVFVDWREGRRRNKLPICDFDLFLKPTSGHFAHKTVY